MMRRKIEEEAPLKIPYRASKGCLISFGGLFVFR
jgi:hypothetical protein